MGSVRGEHGCHPCKIKGLKPFDTAVAVEQMESLQDCGSWYAGSYPVGHSKIYKSMQHSRK